MTDPVAVLEGIAEEILRDPFLEDNATYYADKIAAAIALMRAPVGVVGEVVEIGDDDEGQPRILIHTTREAIKNGTPLAFRTVQVSTMQQTTGGGE